jgi:hypothetical protein
MKFRTTRLISAGLLAGLFSSCVQDLYSSFGPIPPNLRGSVGRSQFSAHFAEVPSDLALVSVRYHDGERSNCSYARLEAPQDA